MNLLNKFKIKNDAKAKTLYDKNYEQHDKSLLYRSVRMVLPLLLDALLLNLAFAAVIIFFKLSFGEEFGAFYSLKYYFSTYIQFTCTAIVINILLGSYRNGWEVVNLHCFCRLFFNVLISFGGYYYCRNMILAMPLSKAFAVGQAVLTLILWLLFRHLVYRIRNWLPRFTDSRLLLAKRTLIVGAGVAGESIAKILFNDPTNRGNPIIFVDDDNGKIGRRVAGIKVAGGREDIPRLAKIYGIERIIIAIPFICESALREILAYCRQSDCEIIKSNFGDLAEIRRQAMTSLHDDDTADMKGGLDSHTGTGEQLNYDSFAELLADAEKRPELIAANQVQDLGSYRCLGDILSTKPIKKSIKQNSFDSAMKGGILTETIMRKPIPYNQNSLYNQYVGKTVCIAGCGTIGQALLNELVNLEPACIILMDNSMMTLANLRPLLSSCSPKIKTVLVLGDVSSPEHLQQELSDYTIDYYFNCVDYGSFQPPLMMISSYERNYIGAAAALAAYAARHQHTTRGFVQVGTELLPVLNATVERLLKDILAANDIPYTTVAVGRVLRRNGNSMMRVNLTRSQQDLQYWQGKQEQGTKSGNTAGEIATLLLLSMNYVKLNHSLEINWPPETGSETGSETGLNKSNRAGSASLTELDESPSEEINISLQPGLRPRANSHKIYDNIFM